MMKKFKILLVFFYIVVPTTLVFQNCAQSPQMNGSDENSVGGGGSQNETQGPTGSEKVTSLVSCAPIRYSFKTFTSALTSQSGTYFGHQFHPYSSSPYPWITEAPFADYQVGTIPTYRLSGYVAESLDCGETWRRTPEEIYPMTLNGGADSANVCSGNEQRANGVNHFITNLNANFYNQGYVSLIRWDPTYLMRARIYSVFHSAGIWSYSAVADGPPLPVIGSSNWSIPDNFYSPSIVEVGDAQKSVQLYFGGWRATLPSANLLPTCQGPSGVISGQNGYTEKDCKCSLFTSLGMAIDSCTGDKIFMATNQFSAQPPMSNPLVQQVYRPSTQTYTSTGWDSSQFEPVIYSAMINNGCHIQNPQKCPFALIHTNDPTVVKFPYPGSPTGYRQIMYFTGGVVPPRPSDPSPGYTHMAISDNNGKSWSQFAILNKKVGLQFPGGLSYNQANGTVRAYYRSDGNKSRIILLSVPTNDNVLFDNSQDDANKVFIYEIDPIQPDLVLSVSKMTMDEHGLSRCEANGPCATAQPYISQIKTPSNRLDCPTGSILRPDGKLGLSNGDTRFLCSKGTWYECGWEHNSSTVIKARDGQTVASYTCNLGAKSWSINTPACLTNCNAGGNTGIDGKVGLPNGDGRFLCSKGAWYDCGWGRTDLTWERSATNGQIVSGLRCDLPKRRWVK